MTSTSPALQDLLRMAEDPEVVASIERTIKGFSRFADTAPLDPGPYEGYKVSVPEGRRGPWAVERFEVSLEESRMSQLRAALNSHRRDRAVAPGRYTRLVHDERGVVMSDTRSEIEEHKEALDLIGHWTGCKRVLIHGLGLGMVLQHAIRSKHVLEIDVVELDQDVIDLVGPHYLQMASEAGNKVLWIHQGDALTFKFDPDVVFEIAWHDIWDTISSDNLPQMHLLHRRYGRKTLWQGSWARDQCEEEKRRWRGGRI